MSGARNRHDIVSLSEHPREGELGRRALVLFRDLLDFRDQLEILLEIRSLKARVLSPEIVFSEIFDSLDLSGEKPATERAVSYETDAEVAERVEQPLLRISRPERILGLHRADRMDLVGSAN